MINYQCACGKSYELKEENAGFSIKCVACEEVGIVPFPAAKKNAVNSPRPDDSAVIDTIIGSERALDGNSRHATLIFIGIAAVLLASLLFPVMMDFRLHWLLINFNLILWSAIMITWFKKNYQPCRLLIYGDKIKLISRRQEKIYRATEIKKIILFPHQSALNIIPWNRPAQREKEQFGFAPDHLSLISLTERLRAVFPNLSIVPTNVNPDVIEHGFLSYVLLIFTATSVLMTVYWGARWTLGNDFETRDPLYRIFPLSRRLICEDPLQRERALIEIEKSDSSEKSKMVLLLISQLNGPQSERAAIALSKIGSPAVPELIKAFGDTEKKETILQLFAEIGADARDSVPMLGKMIKSESPALKKLGFEALGQIGEPAVPILKGFLNDPILRKPALISLSVIGSSAKSAFDDVTKYLDSEDGEWAALAAIKIDPKQAETLGAQAQLQKRLDFLTERLLSPNPRFRRESAEELRDLGTEAAPALPVMMQALSLQDNELRVPIVQTLGKMKASASSVAPVLIEMMNQGGTEISLAAENALAEIGRTAPNVIQLIAQQLKSEKVSSRISACRVLGKIGRNAESVVPALMEAKNVAKGSEQKAMVIALMQIQN